MSMYYVRIMLMIGLCTPGFFSLDAKKSEKGSVCPLSRSSVALISGATGIATWYGVSKLYEKFENRSFFRNTREYQFELCVGAGALTATGVFIALSRMTPEAQYAGAYAILDDVLSDELFEKTFTSDEGFYAYVNERFMSQGWPLADAYTFISDHKYTAFAAGDILRLVDLECKGYGYETLRAACTKALERLPAFDQLTEKMLKLLVKHEKYELQCSLSAEYESRRAAEMEKRIQTAKEVNGYLEITNSVLDIFVKDRRRRR